MSNSAKVKYDSKVDYKNIRAIIVPHAGWNYSGEVAVSCFRLLPKNYYKKVIVLAPSHFEKFYGVVLPQFESYATPIGKLKVDVNSIFKLSKGSLMFYNNSTFDKMFEKEHSLEIELPFIKYFCKEAEIIPLIVGGIDDKNVEVICRRLKEIIDNKTLIIVSSDFTHFGKSFSYIPVKDNIKEGINKIDSNIIQIIEEKSFGGFNNILKTTKSNTCGSNPIKILLWLIENKILGKCNIEVISYDTSSGEKKNPDHSVSYAGIVVTSKSIKFKNLYFSI